MSSLGAITASKPNFYYSIYIHKYIYLYIYIYGIFGYIGEEKKGKIVLLLLFFFEKKNSAFRLVIWNVKEKDGKHKK